MNELPPEASRLIEEARSHSARPADLQRNLERLHATLVFADPVAWSGGESSAESAPKTFAEGSGAGSALGLGKGVKLMLTAVAIGAIGGGALWRASSAPRASSVEARPQHTAEAVASNNEPESQLAPSGSSLPVPMPTWAPAAVEGRVEPLRRDLRGAGVAKGERGSRARTRSRASEPAIATIEAPRDQAQAHEQTRAVSPSQAAEAREALVDTAPRTSNSTSPSELDLIDRALDHLRRQRATAALAELAQHAELHPHGKFATEREGLRAIALCAAGRVREGQAARAAFLRSSPSAPIAAKVTRACDEER